MEKLSHETRLMFTKRKRIYEKALDLGYTTKEAIKFANIWANVTYLGCKYPASLTEVSFKIEKELQE